MKKNTLLLFLILLQLSCKKSNFTGFIDAELSPYIARFIAEGQQRGVTLSTADLEAFLVEEISVETSLSIPILYSIERFALHRLPFAE